MKKIILFLALLTSIYADAKLYTGLNVGYFNESFGDDLDAQNSSIQTSLKVGYGEQKAYAIEFSFDWVKNDSKIFSNKDGDKYSINVELVKAFNLHKYINPFFKVGIGGGRMTIDRVIQSKVNFGSFNLGTGIFIPINETFDIEIGYSYKYL
ncbi:MAG: porin family protein, partial [Epsilonproteobacteria bacterium]|nr:porin family protein [Campylobacterota bacterium]